MRRTALFVLLVSHAARAQGVSDVMPPQPPPARGAGGLYLPGMPVPQPQEASPPAAGAPGKGETKAPSGLLLYEQEYTLEEPKVVAPEAATPGSVVVKKGDTLWGLSATYLHDPYSWPKLWSYNPSITNPHWIYPGDVIRLVPPGQEPAPAPAPLKPAAAATTPEPRRLIPPQAPESVALRNLGFVETRELESAATIVGAREERLLLATLDEAYVEYKKDKPLQRGSRYVVYKPIRTVKHPVTGERLGEMVRIYGEVEVDAITSGNIARARITDSNDPIERGYRVGPLKRQYRMPEHRPARTNQIGLVVAQIRDLELIGAHVIVFVDRGSKDGIEVGNRFTVVRRGDGYQPLLWRGGPIEDKRFPREDYGEVIVIETRDRLATCLVLRTPQEVRVGDRVEMRKTP